MYVETIPGVGQASWAWTETSTLKEILVVGEQTVFTLKEMFAVHEADGVVECTQCTLLLCLEEAETGKT